MEKAWTKLEGLPPMSSRQAELKSVTVHSTGALILGRNASSLENSGGVRHSYC
jgi:hypothetical protein